MHEHGLRRMGTTREPWPSTRRACTTSGSGHSMCRTPSDPPGLRLVVPPVTRPRTSSSSAAACKARASRSTSRARHRRCRGRGAWIGAGATGRSRGLVRVHYDLLAETRLALGGVPVVPGLARVGGDCGFTRTGFLWLEPGDGDRASGPTCESTGRWAWTRHWCTSTPSPGSRPRWRSTGTRSRRGSRRPATRTRRYAGSGSSGRPRAGAHGWSRRGGHGDHGRDGGTRVEGVRTTRGDRGAGRRQRGRRRGRASAALVGPRDPLTVWRHDTGYLGVPASVAAADPRSSSTTPRCTSGPRDGGAVLVGLEDDNQMGGSPDRDTAAAPGSGTRGRADRAACRASSRAPSGPRTRARTA